MKKIILTKEELKKAEEIADFRTEKLIRSIIESDSELSKKEEVSTSKKLDAFIAKVIRNAKLNDDVPIDMIVNLLLDDEETVKSLSES
jgi:hypothetical protein